MLAPEDTAFEPDTPQPVVPPTAIVPASAVVITTSGVASLARAVTGVVSDGAAAAVSKVNEVSVRAPAVFPAESVKVTVQT